MSERIPPPATTMSSLSSQSELLTSRSTPLDQPAPTRSGVDHGHDHYFARHRSKTDNFGSHGGELTTTLSHSLLVIDGMYNLSSLSIDEMNVEFYKESLKRQKAERNAIEALRRAKTSEDLYAKEVNRRKEIEEALAREKLEVKMLENQNRKILEQLQTANKKNQELEPRIADSDSVSKKCCANGNQSLSCSSTTYTLLSENYVNR
ncbi:uncharacterized protein LOC109827252 [Asparagus officinalis]|uniref:uncharacterized protein LOC109827252 n=1 Tax=Asparagus officinalis TaxID=4686 RepID=UPI00098DF17D|nr:uncharacterized protein LOC109827252 [Asparagus officinalis]